MTWTIKCYITSTTTRLQSPAASVKAWVCVWVFRRAGSKTCLQSTLLSAFGEIVERATPSELSIIVNS